MGNHLNNALSGICEGDPLSPPEGEAAQGGHAPLTPDFELFFHKGILYLVLLHGASPIGACIASAMQI